MESTKVERWWASCSWSLSLPYSSQPFPWNGAIHFKRVTTEYCFSVWGGNYNLWFFFFSFAQCRGFWSIHRIVQPSQPLNGRTWPSPQKEPQHVFAIIPWFSLCPASDNHQLSSISVYFPSVTVPWNHAFMWSLATGLHSPSMKFSRFIHIMPSVRVSLLFMAE